MKVFTVAVVVIGATLAQMTAGVPLDQPVPPTPDMGTRSGILPSDNNATVPTCSTSDELPLTRNGRLSTIYRWNGKFTVYLDPTFDERERRNINRVLFDLGQLLPCLQFGIFPEGTTPHGDYVHIIKGTNNGCNSYVGRRGGRQNMNLQSPGCSTHYTATMHEMIHALGFRHEQCRPDRDDFVTIHWENITPRFQFAFNKYSTSEVTTFGVPYNPRSIMHYRAYDFSKNGQRTITAKNGEPVGWTNVVQETDKQKLKLMYNC